MVVVSCAPSSLSEDLVLGTLEKVQETCRPMVSSPGLEAVGCGSLVLVEQ